jgi:UDP:flavonoid glycosyltransferase YjiC (YdhE family)
MKILFTSTRGLGHLYPLLPLARAARDAGDEVRFAVPATTVGAVLRHDFSAEVATSGETSPAVAAVFGQLPASKDPLLHVIREYWAGALVEERLPILRRIITAWRPDLVVNEVMDLAAPIAAEASGVPHVPLGVNALRVGHVGIDAAVERLNDARRSAGLPDRDDIAWAFRHLYVTPFPGFLEHPDLVRPATTVTYRHQDPDGCTPSVRPARSDARRPRVYASLGTKATEDDQQLAAHRIVLAALGLVDADVTFTVGGLSRPALGLVPGNVRLAGHLPPRLTMDCDVVLTHAGAGTTTTALSRGLPLVCVPLFGDQPHNAERVAAVGAGLSLPVSAGPRAVAAALDEVLATPSYGEVARSLGTSLAAAPTVEAVVPMLHDVAEQSGGELVA